nr:GNAT family N-acetyltransferase [Neobacillus sp. Marseille-Q6967]
MKTVSLKLVEQNQRMMFFDFLLLADESEEVVKEYIFDGEMYSIDFEGDIAGVVLFTFHPDNIVELKNIALGEEFREKGIGKLVLNEAFHIYQQQGYHQIIVGTANSSIPNLAFYQKAGFRMYEIKKDFFKKYPLPIYEHGIRALDLIMFKKNLSE